MRETETIAKDTYVLRLNKLCKSCGHRNIIDKVTDEPIEVLACGNCGVFIMIPSNMDLADRKAIEETIKSYVGGK